MLKPLSRVAAHHAATPIASATTESSATSGRRERHGLVRNLARASASSAAARVACPNIRRTLAAVL